MVVLVVKVVLVKGYCKLLPVFNNITTFQHSNFTTKQTYF